MTDVIKLASNENPLGPSPRAVESIRRMILGLNRYPDPLGYHLRGSIAERLGLSREWVVLGNGSTEIVEQICRAFLDPGDEAITGKEMFFKYPIAIHLVSAKPLLVPLTDYKLDVHEVLKRVTKRTKVVFIANPNNPTGTLIQRKDLDEFMQNVPPEVVVVFDEAYHEYLTHAQDPDSLRYVRGGRNVIVLRTFSKIYGLAGLRIGYGLAPPRLIASLNKVREAFNTNAIAQDAALAALDDADFIRRTRATNETGRTYVAAHLEKLGIPPVPTCTNFHLVPLPLDGQELSERLLERGVIVRPMGGYGLDNAIRVTIGLPQENERFLEAIARLL